jgi:hypothetical protein
MRRLLCAAPLVAPLAVIPKAHAGEAEEKVIAGCVSSARAGAVGYVGCVAAGLTGNEVSKCIATPSQCYGPNNEVRKLFCSIGIGGCPKPPDPAELLSVGRL